MVAALGEVLGTCLDKAREFARLVSPAGDPAHATAAMSSNRGVRIGVANPSNLGCTHGRGGGANWKPLTGKVGAVETMAQLRLDALGLPGARVPPGLRAAADASWDMVAKRGLKLRKLCDHVANSQPTTYEHPRHRK